MLVKNMQRSIISQVIVKQLRFHILLKMQRY